MTIEASDLVDDQGGAGDPAAPVGFGFFVNDLLVVSETLAFAVVNAGGSDSSPALANLVAFDPTAGEILQVVDLAQQHPDDGMFVDSSGNDVPNGGFVQSGAEALAYVPSLFGPGRLYVAMTNLIFGAPSYGAVKYPGTLQVYDVVPEDDRPEITSLADLRVLVIDDNRTNRRILRELLGHWSMSCTLTDGAQAGMDATTRSGWWERAWVGRPGAR